MARKLLSFLGTNNYVACTYFLASQEVADVRFVQEALVKLHCSDWTPEDQIIIFVTPEADRKNWANNGHIPENNAGLYRCLSALNLPCRIRPVLIPNGKSEDEIWEIFSIVCNELAASDAVTLDITHALRSLPMLAMVVLQYLRVLRNVHLQGIFYGAFEALGSVEEVKKMVAEERRAPIFDLTSFARLADWSIAVDRFLAAGDAGMIHELVRLEAIPFIKAGPTDTKHGHALAVKNLTKRLLDFTKAMATCRGLSISQCATSLNQALDDYRQAALVPPLVPLLEKIRERTADFNGNEIRDGISAARWCFEHNLIQQAYTILQETAVSFFLLKAEGGPNDSHPLDVSKRAMVKGAASLLAQKKESAEGRFPPGHEELWQKIWSIMGKTDENYRKMSFLEQYRNDLNHAGMNQNPKRAEKFDRFLEEAIQWLEGVMKNGI
ncbi:MAG: TIGR02221 family CRISPR-associated protein [Desulfoarculaceae bacterium]|nr:TIGR02221 family CRISPR-associated protein [Desulfoarculaceae bacterium]